MDLRLFANLEEAPLTMQHSWAKGLRVYLGATPVGFEPGYIDPLGRVVTVSVRKVF